MAEKEIKEGSRKHTKLLWISLSKKLSWIILKTSQLRRDPTNIEEVTAYWEYQEESHTLTQHFRDKEIKQFHPSMVLWLGGMTIIKLIGIWVVQIINFVIFFFQRKEYFLLIYLKQFTILFFIFETNQFSIIYLRN